MSASNLHTLKAAVAGKYEYVRPIPKLNIPELQENEGAKPQGNDYEYIPRITRFKAQSGLQ